MHSFYVKNPNPVIVHPVTHVRASHYQQGTFNKRRRRTKRKEKWYDDIMASHNGRNKNAARVISSLF